MICVSSHDAGGAEILSSYVRQQGLDCAYALGGPALKIFERKIGALDSMPLADAIHQSDWLLCGTSWQSDLEWQAIEIARAMGKRSVAFLDHWVNYRERFVRGGETHLPDEIWVGDTLAETMARRIFPELSIRLIENPYFDDLRRELAQLTRSSETSAHNLRVLYVCEPLREHALREYGNERYWGYTEEDALRYFLSNLPALMSPVERIVIRPHPSEVPGKYDWAKQEFDLPIVRGGAKTLFEEVAECDVVVGCESMAMVIGLLAERRVISCIPPGGKLCGLPHPEIEPMQDFIKSGGSMSL
jgi:hypothetical protein